eukprot:scaffold127328_cov16-Tisochrysis_lutea.AAC.1
MQHSTLALMVAPHLHELSWQQVVAVMARYRTLTTLKYTRWALTHEDIQIQHCHCTRLWCPACAPHPCKPPLLPLSQAFTLRWHSALPHSTGCMPTPFCLCRRFHNSAGNAP